MFLKSIISYVVEYLLHHIYIPIIVVALIAGYLFFKWFFKKRRDDKLRKRAAEQEVKEEIELPATKIAFVQYSEIKKQEPLERKQKQEPKKVEKAPQPAPKKEEVRPTKVEEKKVEEQKTEQEIVAPRKPYFSEAPVGSPVKRELNDIITLDAYDKKPEEQKKVLGKFEIFREGQFYKFRLKANNGEVLCVSELYKTLEGCKQAIQTVKRNVKEGSFTVRADKNGMFKFKMFAKNHRALIVSSGYPSRANCESALESFKRFSETNKIVQVEAEAETVDSKNLEAVAKNNEQAELNGKYEIEADGDEFVFKLKASNGEILCHSESYLSKASCMNAIQSFKNHVEQGTFYVTKDKNGRYHFKLYSSSNRLIIVGESYTNKQSAISAVSSVRRFYKEAKIIE